MTSYQSTQSQSSHEECGHSVGQLTSRPPDPSATLRDSSELDAAVAQCVIPDTASQDRALWHTEPRVTQQGLSRDRSNVCVLSGSHQSRSITSVQNFKKIWCLEMNSVTLCLLSFFNLVAETGNNKRRLLKLCLGIRDH